MGFDIAFNPPQFLEEYDGLKMRQLVDELERLHAALTADTDDEGVEALVTSFNTRVGDVLPEEGDYTLTLLGDVDTTGGAKYDLLFNETGTEWRPTDGDLIWNHDLDFLQLANDHSINWLDSQGTSVELAILTADVLPQPAWANVAYLADFNGVDEATSYTTVDSTGYALTNIGTKLDDAQVKFGTTATYFDANNDSWTAGTDNGGISDSMVGDSWCVEGWMYNETLPSVSTRGGHLLAGAWAAAANERQFNIAINTSGEIQFEWSSDGTSGGVSSVASTGAGLNVIDVWNHVAVSYDGATLRMFSNGSLVYSAASSGVVNDSGGNSGADLVVGRIIAFPDDDYPFRGWLDDVRVTVGEPVYTQPFIAPTSAHPIGTGGIAEASSEFILGDPGFLTHIDGTLIELSNTIGINWQDDSGNPIEFLVADVGSSNEDPFYNNVTFLAKLDGADAATTDTTEDSTGYTLTFIDNAQLDTAQKAFPESDSSLLCDGTGDYVVGASSGLVGNLSNTDWTIEGWVRFNTDPTVNGDTLLSKWGTAGNRCWRIGLTSSDELYIVTTNDGTNNDWVHNETWAPSTATWYHWAICRDGVNLRFFVDGTQIGTTTNVGTDTVFDQTSTDIHIGEYVGMVANRAFDGWQENVRITETVARYTSNFTRPSLPFPEVQGLGGSFTVGDPNTPTIIEGESVNITSASTDIDGTLNTDGATTLQSTLQVAGLADFDANVDINDATLRVWDTTGADNLAISHDGTDALLAFTNTADWNVTGLTGSTIFSQPIEGNASAAGVVNTINLISAIPSLWWSETDGSAAEQGWKMWANGDTFNFYTTTDAGVATDRIFDVTRTGTAANLIDFSVPMLIDGGSAIDLEITSAAPSFNITETGVAVDAGKWTMFADSSVLAIGPASDGGLVDEVLTFTRTLAQGDEVNVRSGASFRVYDGTNTDYIDFAHDGTDANWTSSGTTDINITLTAGGFIRTVGDTGISLGIGGDIYTNGGFLRIRDNGANDYAQFAHDGTDFNVTFTNTTRTEWGGGSQTFKLGGTGTGNSNVLQIGKGFDSSSYIDFIRGGGEAIDVQVEVDVSENLFFALDPANALGQDQHIYMSYHGTNHVDFDNNGFALLGGHTLFIEEQANAQADRTGYGQLWVKNTTPCELWFTDDAGTDTQIV